MELNKKSLFRVLLILAVGIVLSYLIIAGKPAPEPEDHKQPPPHVAEVISAQPDSRAITLSSQGTVTAKNQIDIAAQVSGQVVSVGEHFAAGGFFEAGEVLLTIDPRDYEIAVIEAESALAEAKNQLAQEEGQGRQAKRQWRDLGTAAANDLFLRKPQLLAAQARVKAAEAGLRAAKLALERTQIALPFDGRVVKVSANLGQFINSGSTLGSVYASNVMEVRLPLTATELKLLNLHAANKMHELSPLTVEFFFATGTDVLQWQGDVVRLEAAVDTKSRLFYLVAEINNRVDEFTEQGKPAANNPVLPGMFVKAKITSNHHEDVVLLPRSALFRSSQVLVLDDEQRLRAKDITILQMDSATLAVQGLENDEQVLGRPPGFMDLGEVYSAVPFEKPDSPAAEGVMSDISQSETGPASQPKAGDPS